MSDVSGRYATMTSGAQGLSRGMAEGLLENGCGVVLINTQKEKLKAMCEEHRVMGYEAYEVCGNLSGRMDVDRISIEAMEILGGKLDVPIPAAGVQRRHLPKEFLIEGWDLVPNINLNAAFLMIQKALRVMLKQAADGKIITTGSMVTWFRETTVSVYTVSKGTVPQLTKSLAIGCAGRNININCICPGYMGTEMYADVIQEREDEYAVCIPAGR